MFVTVSLADAENIDRLVGKIPGPFGGRQDHGRSAVGDQRTVQQVQRIGDHPGVHDVIDRNQVPHLCRRIQRRVLAARNRYRGQLFGRGAIGFHVRSCDQRVKRRDGWTIRGFKLRVANRGLYGHGLFPRQAGQQIIGCRDQHGIADAGDDC